MITKQEEFTIIEIEAPAFLGNAHLKLVVVTGFWNFFSLVYHELGK